MAIIMTKTITKLRTLTKMIAAKVGKGDCTEKGVSGGALNSISSSLYL